MSSDIWVILILSALLILTNSTWAFVVLKLLNRLMSRNYGEYIQSENLKVRLPRDSKVNLPDPELEAIEKQRADEINRMMGMI